MSSEAKQLAVVQKSSLPVSLQMNETELMSVLKSSLYPGAKDESIKLVVGYCKAQALDPMQKPVHIVPMSVKEGDDYVWRDVIMPGIGLYRTQAARSGQFAGVSEPEFGEDVTEKLGDVEVTYPKWCKVTVRRLLSNGQLAEFTAVEYWKENYATKKRDTKQPNAMWMKRTRGQIAKCTEAQALRKAFPEMVGSAPTAEEMEGKTLDDTTIIDGTTGEIISKQTVEQPRSKSETVKPADQKTAEVSAPAGDPIDEPKQRLIRAMLKGSGVLESALCDHFKVQALGELRMSQINAAIAFAQGKEQS